MKNENKTMADIRHKKYLKPQSASTKNPMSQPNSTRPTSFLSSSKNLIRKPIKNMDIAKSNAISRFAPKNQPASINQTTGLSKKAVDRSSTKPISLSHPVMQKIQPKITQTNSTKEIKDAAIAEAFEKIAERQKQEKELAKKRRKLIQKVLTVLTIVCVGAYILFVNLPALALGYVNTKSGFEASLLSFCPGGYIRDGFAHLENDSVMMKFKSSISNSSFTIGQTKSTWDSSAVKNMVDEQSAGKFITAEKNGLTIFSYNNSTSAAWVNGGILYTITGDASLKIDEIQQIALSL